MSLTDIELKEVERTWGIVSLNLKQHGVEILMALFTTYPQYRSLFKRFEGIKTEELRNKPSMKAHASSLMHGIATFVDNLEDGDTLERLVQDNVGRHFKRSVRAEQYKNTLNLIPGYLQTALGSELTPEGASGWKKVIDTLCALFEKEVAALEK